jgi:FKBP-type peptidyl-prolyl cis-trans isomerase
MTCSLIPYGTPSEAVFRLRSPFFLNGAQMVFSWLRNLKNGLVQGNLRQKQAQARRRPLGSVSPQLTPVIIEALECRRMLSGSPVAATLAGFTSAAATVNPPAPVISGVGGTTSDAAPSTPITVAPNLVITGTLNISNATVSFTNWQDGDRLQFTNTYALQHTFVENVTANTATFTLTGVASIAAYQATLRTVQFWDVAGNPIVSNRVATFTVTDIDSDSSLAATQNIGFNLSGQSSPVVSGISGTTSDTAPATPITIAPSLVVTDTVNISSATVSFTNWQDGDRLEFTNSYALQHTFVENVTANTATLTLTGVASVAAYQATLRSVQFWDVAGNPNVSTRVATFTVTDIDSDSSPAATQNISFNLSGGSSPVVSGIGGTTTDTAPATPITIAPNLVVTDTVNISSATVSFTNWQDGDRLQFTNSYALQHTFVVNSSANTATLTLTGVASIAAYQATLQTVQFWDVAGNPNVSTRVATFIVTDIDSDSSPAATQNISFSLSGKSSPVVSGIGGTTSDTAPATPITIAPNLVVTDTVNISSATVSFTNWQDGDRLQFTNSYALQHTFVENSTTNTATLTLTGVASIAAYQATLQSVQFWTAAGNPVTWLQRVATFTVNDIYGNSGSGTQNIKFSPASAVSPPGLSGIAGVTSYAQLASPVAVAPSLVVTDSLNLSGATISFTNWQAGDRLQFTNTYSLQNTFVENATTNTATLTISGLATVAQYQTTLRSVQFWSVAGNPVTSVQRVATFSVADSYAIPGSGSQNIAVSTTTAPTVNNQAAATTTPTITGTFPTFTKNAPVLTVTVNGTTYTLGTSPQLTSPSTGSWILNLAAAPLPTTTSSFTVTATMTNSFGNQLSGTGTVTNEQAIIQAYLTANNLTATKTATGLDYVITTNGTGAIPTRGQTVTANYSGYFLNSNGTLGAEFDSNVDSKFGHVSPFSFTLGVGQVIAGWDQGFSLLPVGTAATLLIPSYLGYGTLGAGSSIPANSILIFKVKVISAT